MGRRRRNRIIPARAGFTAGTGCRASARRDHPRSRGVYTEAAGKTAGERGSSPLARGLREDGSHDAVGGRIIPARAGFTFVVWGTTNHEDGSSPLARGLRRGAVHRDSERRIIPARAGFTTPARLPAPTGSDHPRSRGVYWGTTQRGRTTGGSSPLARGLLNAAAIAFSVAWIIPARAGFTTLGWARCHSRGDHPRSRGVYWDGDGVADHVGGSSPLARGLRLPTMPIRLVRRIIPARAGFTGGLSARRGSQQDHPRSRGVYRGSAPVAVDKIVDHPRSRGVYFTLSETTQPNWGSSPLARGLQGVAVDLRLSRRIIPARAGFTAPPHQPRALPGDHPRSRGVYRPVTPDEYATLGSSPLARGLRAKGRF